MKRSQFRRPIAFAVLLALAEVGCGQAERVAGQAASDPSPSASVGLCSLFTTKEMEDALGVPLSPGNVGGPLDTVCQWDGSTKTDAITKR